MSTVCSVRGGEFAKLPNLDHYQIHYIYGNKIIVIHMHQGVYEFYKPEGPRL